MQQPAIPLKQMNEEMAATRRLLERVPTDRGPWKPHEKSFPLGHLAQLIASMPGWIAGTLRRPVIDPPRRCWTRSTGTCNRRVRRSPPSSGRRWMSPGHPARRPGAAHAPTGRGRPPALPPSGPPSGPAHRVPAADRHPAAADLRTDGGRAVTRIIVLGLSLGLLVGCAAAARPAALRPEREPDCSFGSATTCWTIGTRLPARRAEARDSVPAELLGHPQLLVASAHDSAAQTPLPPR
jgi:hypothetical protein